MDGLWSCDEKGRVWADPSLGFNDPALDEAIRSCQRASDLLLSGGCFAAEAVLRLAFERALAVSRAPGGGAYVRRLALGLTATAMILHYERRGLVGVVDDVVRDYRAGVVESPRLVGER